MSNLTWIIVLTLAFEAVTCFFRFGLGMESTRDTSALASFTFGYRIHHGYIGILMVLVTFLMPEESQMREWLLRVGFALFLSDLVHHFLVLWPITGDHEFHIKYTKQ